MKRALLTVLFLGSLASMASAAATITIVNGDPAGAGFNDPTPVAPVGGNAGTTLGQQRLNVFQAAANTWGAILTSSVQITVLSTFEALSCNATSAVLGSAGPQQIFANFSGAELTNYWYHEALANKLSNSDLAPGVDDIRARFNINLGNTGCLTGIGWYYGLDHNHGTQVDLLVVLAHELGHGLGFSTVTSGSSGAYLSGLPAIWDHYLYDPVTGLDWDQMTAGQRVTSAVSGKLAWSGAAVRTQTPSFQGARPLLQISAPAPIAGLYDVGPAAFGAPLTPGGVSGEVVLVDDPTPPATDGCDTPFNNAAALNGKIAFIDRGLCTFVLKAQNAQAAGATALIVANNAAGTLLPGGADPTITIPVVGITQADGNTIRAQLGAGTVTADLRIDPGQFAGADVSGRMRMYTPNPFQSGSSVSHFDVSASPNLLMEPAINGDLTSSVDLTRYLFEDIGWFQPRQTDAPAHPSATTLVNLPNPVRGETSVRFTLRASGNVDLAVYDLVGRRMAQLADGYHTAGAQAVTWSATDDAGRRVPPGLYMARLRAGNQIESRSMLVVR